MTLLILLAGTGTASAPDVEGDASVSDFTIYAAAIVDATIYAARIADTTIYSAAISDMEVT